MGCHALDLGRPILTEGRDDLSVHEYQEGVSRRQQYTDDPGDRSGTSVTCLQFKVVDQAALDGSIGHDESHCGIYLRLREGP